MTRLIVIVGPTASGKTRLAVDLALQTNGEIVTADSRQVYRHMDIGTAKPSAADRAAVPHHLLDIVDPDEPFSLALYRENALRAIAGIVQRGKQPILVGGTGQYVWALVEGWAVPAVPPDLELRGELEQEADLVGHHALHETLAKVDIETAKAIDPRNVRRVIRALEVWHTAGVPFSFLRKKTAPPFDSLILGLTVPRADLYRRIDSRVEWMMENGLTEEVRGLLSKGYHVDLAPMTGIGYMEISSYLANRIELPSAVQRIKFRTHHLARRQYAWFGLDDARIHWLTSDEHSLEAAIALVRGTGGENT